MAEELAKQGLIASGGRPEVLSDLIAHDVVKWRKIINDGGITAE